MTGNTDDDAAEEVAAVFSQAQAGDSSTAPVSFSVAIFDRTFERVPRRL